jgi:hypothetical protein
VIWLLVLAALLAGPGLRAHCLVSCAVPAQPAASASCHDEPHRGAALEATHGCVTAATSAARLGSHAPVYTGGSTLAPTPGPTPRDTGVLDRLAPSRTATDTSPPIPSFFAPLRI